MGMVAILPMVPIVNAMTSGHIEDDYSVTEHELKQSQDNIVIYDEEVIDDEELNAMMRTKGGFDISDEDEQMTIGSIEDRKQLQKQNQKRETIEGQNDNNDISFSNVSESDSDSTPSIAALIV